MRLIQGVFLFFVVTGAGMSTPSGLESAWQPQNQEINDRYVKQISLSIAAGKTILPKRSSRTSKGSRARRQNGSC